MFQEGLESGAAGAAREQNHGYCILTICQKVAASGWSRRLKSNGSGIHLSWFCWSFSMDKCIKARPRPRLVLHRLSDK